MQQYCINELISYYCNKIALMKTVKNKTYDWLGISSAGICLIHCLGFPLLTVIPFGLSHDHYIDLLFALIGLIAILRIRNLRQHKNVQYILWASISLIFLSVFMDMLFHFHSPLIYMGATGLIVGHILNFKNHKQ